jgi:K+-transporting ATPase ATPase C chain
MNQTSHSFFALIGYPAIRLLLLCSLLTGFLYPGLVMIMAQSLFPFEANGSLITHQGVRVGSYWIGQSFTEPHYFWGRPSGTPSIPYNALSSSGTNFGPGDPKNIQQIQTSIQLLHLANKGINTLIPFNLVAASGSGLDPEISPAAARYQVFRVAKARQAPIETIAHLVENAIISRSANILGEPRVNVLQLNLALDRIVPITLHDIRNSNGKAP